MRFFNVNYLAASRPLHENQVGIRGFRAGRCQHGVRLPAMMRLVIENMHDRQPARLDDVLLRDA